MNKIVDGVELLRMIRDGELKVDDKVKYEKTVFKVMEGNYYNYLLDEEGDDLEGNSITADNIIDSEIKFEILAEPEEIDIYSIEELSNDIDEIGWVEVQEKINELIKAVKQINRKVEGK